MSSKEKKIALEDDYQSIIHNLDVGFFRVGLDGIVHKHNPKFNEIFGIDTNENLVGSKSFDFWYNSEDRDKFIEELKNKGFVKNYITPVRKVTGEKIIIQGNSHLVKDKKGNPIATEGTIIDITEKYLLEEKLERSEERYRDLVELLPDIIYEANLDLNLTYVNPVAFKKFGYSQEDLNNGINITQIIDPSYKEKAFSNTKKIFRGEETKPDEYLLRKKDGSGLYVRIHSRPIYNNGHIIGLRGTINDINEMILADQKLKESEDKFRTITEQSFMGIIIIQDGVLKYINEQARKFNGYSLEEVQNWEPYEFSKLIHPDDREFVMEQARKKQAGERGIIQQYKYRLITKTGDVRWIEIFSKTINYEGKPADFIMSVDITNRIHAEEELKESVEKYRLIADNSQDIVYTLDMNLNNTYISPSVYNVLGYPVDEAMLMQPKDNVDKDDLKKISRIYKEEFKLEHKDDKDKDLNRRRVFTIRERHKDGRNLIMEHTISWLRDEKGNAVGILGVARDITEKKRTENLLKESEEKYRLISENANDLIAVLDMNLNYEYINEGHKILGYTKEKIYNTSAPDLIHPEDVKRALNAFREGSKKGSNSEELRVKHKDGHYSWFEVKGKLIQDRNEEQKALLISRDITERKKIEKQLKESEEKYRSLFENMNTGFAYHEVVVDENNHPIDYIYHEVNPAFEKLTGLKKEDLIGRRVTEAIPGTENDPADWIGKFGNVALTGIPLTVEDYSEAMDRWYKVSGYSPKKGFFAVTFTDITDRKKAEKSLHESEEKYRKLFENSPVALMDQDFSKMKKYVDHLKASGVCNFEEYFNDKPEEALRCVSKVKVIDVNKKTLEVYRALNKENFISRMNQLVDGVDTKMTEEIFLDNKKEMLSLINGNTEYESEIVSKNIAGESIYLYGKTSIVPGFENTWSKVIVSILDITDMKLTEQRLKESEEKFRTITEQSLMGICIIQDFEIKYLNQQMADIYEYSLDEVKSWEPKEFLKVLHPDSRDIVLTQIIKKQQGDLDVIAHYVAKIITKKGKIRWVENFSKPIIYQGNPADLLTQIDITSKMEAENKIRISEEKYRHLYENSPYAILLFNIRGYILDCNFRSQELSGFERTELIGKNFQEISFIPKEYLPIVLKDFKALINGKPVEPKEIKLFKKDKTLVWVSYQVSTFQIEDEKIFQVMIQDITERKKAEQKVVESEEKYHNLFETSPNGVILTDLKGTILECNSALENISGYSTEEFIGKNFVDFDFYMENALEIIKEGFEDLFGNNSLEYLEFPIKHKDNRKIWVHVNSSIITMRAQTYILVVVYDITTQKIAEESIKKSEEKYRDLLETSSVGVLEFDIINRKMTYINPKLLEIIGYKKEELTEEIFLNNLIHQKDLTKLLRSNEESELEFRIYDKQGKLKWLAGKRIPNFDENGEIVSIRVWLDEITEKKMYEELIYELNINFLNFTADIRNNIDLLLNTGLKLLNGDLIVYAHKNESAGKEKYQILTSDNESYLYNSKEFHENLFISEIFTEGHDFPQEFYNINNMKYIGFDPFINKNNFKCCFGKAIKSQEGLDNLVCVFYKNNPIFSGQDKLVLFLICDAIEIEQRRWRVQQDLEKQNITLNEINKLKTELFSRTSHELKTPLISIKGFTELLLTLHKSKLDPETISILEEIKDGSKRLEKIINLLLESSKLEEGQLKLNIAEEDLTFLINFCVKELKGLARLRNQSILFDSNKKLEAKFDKERIYEVISNLLLNAVKYTPPGGTISIETEVVDGSYIISVKDNGIGFTEEEKNQVFKQFGKIERYGQGWDVAIEGTGLGLYITKKLVELHGGKIWLESEGRNKGSTFSFSIPKL